MTNEDGSCATDQLATVSTDMDAPIDDVWQALTTDGGLAPWMGQGASIGTGEGGPVSVPDVATGRPREGFIETFTPGENLAFRWWPEDEPDAVTCVSISLEPLADRTRVTVTESAPSASIALPGSSRLTKSFAGSPAGAAWRRRSHLLADSHRLAVSLHAR